LYLGFHGEEETIRIGDGREIGCRIHLEDLIEQLEGRCDRRIIYLGSCSTMKTDGRRLQSFLRRTGALAICGYKDDVDMLRSAAFELLLFDILLENALNLNGVKAMRRKLQTEARSLVKELGFRMVIRGST
jgi:hypothetical protein